MSKESNVELWRVAVVVLILAGSAVGLVLRVGYLQIIQHDYFAQMAADEHWGKQEIIPHRGDIRDRNGHILATTVTAFDMYIDPSVPQTPEKIAKTASLLSPLIGIPSGQITSALQRKSDKPFLLTTNVAFETGNKISDMSLPGIETRKTTKRVYPEGNLASPVIGFLGRDERGLAGVEADFNTELLGKPGELVYERDTAGGEIPLGLRDGSAPEEGADVVLTIDRFIQRLVESQLDQAMKKHSSSSATVIVMEVKTGAILAVASRPSFDITKLDLNDTSKAPLYKVSAISDMYEPGSIFKVFTMASALEEKLVKPNTTFNCTGVVYKNGWAIRNWNGAAHGKETMTDILKYSCNIGTVWVSDQLGADRFYKHIKDFGFGQPTNIELSGEAAGQVRTNKAQGWSSLDLAVNAFGQGISVTPLQLITAFGAIANGGKLMRPYIAKQVVDSRGTRDYQPVVVRRVISEETARTLSQMMNVSGEQGTGGLASVPGFRIAGKSGTAQIPVRGGYTGNNTVAGFAGFAPLEDPRIVILVRVDEPKDIPWGSSVAAPLFKNIMEQTLLYLKVPPTDASKVGKLTW